GPVLRSAISDVGQPRLEERLQSGVELLGADASQALVADAELLRLLLACLRQLKITEEHKPTLLIGHHAVLSALLDQVPAEQRLATRQALVSFDPLALAELQLPAHQRQGLQQLLRLRGDTKAVLYQLEQLLGPSALLEQLAGTLHSVAATAAAQGVRLQLDPSFQPHFDLYDGLVLKLVCQGPVAPVALASGGRYDALVARFGGVAGGMGFGFDVEALRDLLGTEATAPQRRAATLVAYGDASQLSAALDQLEALHRQGEPAELLQCPSASREAAEVIAAERGCAACHWVAS
ncbi:MAG: ATP phosphoribosyltransferase regulatory subunit, partial [Vulcanococcus sp.]|nr:ATP phosphoribosyltransferase regulatory subunit [Vulcanococcus sp.]